MNKERIIREALALPTSAIEYHVSQYLAEKFPEKALLEGNDGLFNVEAYAQAGHCSLEMQTFVHDQIATRWHGREIDTFPQGIRYISSIRTGLPSSPDSDEQEMDD